MPNFSRLVRTLGSGLSLRRMTVRLYLPTCGSHVHPMLGDNNNEADDDNDEAGDANEDGEDNEGDDGKFSSPYMRFAC